MLPLGGIKKRPAHLSIVERLGEFWWCKYTKSFQYDQNILEENHN